MPVHATHNPQPAARKLVPLLLSWFSTNARDLPWRRTHDPYAVWVSEIMLQQTQVKTVIPYWERWMRELPTIEAVAKASAPRLHKLWEGLGYYTRVRNLHRAAQQIIAPPGGKFPTLFEQVLALPGIGRYTAGAICSIAFNQPTPILDGNVIRVLTRLFGIGANPHEKKTNEKLWQLAEELVSHAARLDLSLSRRHKEARANLWRSQSLRTSAATVEGSCSALNQSLMELGALICAPRAPNCATCPVRKLCAAFHKGKQEEFPNLSKRAKTTARRFIACVIERDGRFLVRQRPAGVVNAQLWEFPNVEVASPTADFPLLARSKLGIRVSKPAPLCTIKHSITRYRITLEVWRADFGSSSSTRSKLHGRWLAPARLNRLAFTSAHKKILQHLARHA